MRSNSKTLRFPLAGIAEHKSYRDSTYPSDEEAFAAPSACNVRGRCAFGDRARGGSRPGFANVTGVGSSSTGKWLWPNGEAILWPDGANMVFSEPGSRYTMLDGSTMIDQHETFRIVANKGAVPTDASICSFYRARLLVASGSMWYASRIGDVNDWDYGVDSEDISAACAGNAALSGRAGEEITAFMCIGDDAIYVTTVHSLWVAAGDIRSGLRCISEDIGCVGANAWCRCGSSIVFLSNSGVYSVGSNGISRLSDRAPEEFVGIDTDDEPLLVFDPYYSGVHILTNDADWWFDLEAKAFWPVTFKPAHHPIAGFKAMAGGTLTAVFKCEDNNYRVFDPSADKDGGSETISSHVDIGPFRVSARDDLDGIIDDVVVATGLGSADVTVKVASGHSAEDAVAAAKAGTFGVTFVAKAGWNNVFKTRTRGAWCVVRIASTGKWAYESINVACKQLGRLR